MQVRNKQQQIQQLGSRDMPAAVHPSRYATVVWKSITVEVEVKVENDVVHTVKKSLALGSEVASDFRAVPCDAASSGTESSGAALKVAERPGQRGGARAHGVTKSHHVPTSLTSYGTRSSHVLAELP